MFTAAYIVFECDHLGCCSGSYCEIEFENLCCGALIYKALIMCYVWFRSQVEAANHSAKIM